MPLPATKSPARLAGLAPVLCLLWAGAANAEIRPDYEPQLRVTGVISVSGDAADRGLIEGLQAAFVKHQPGIAFENSLHGPESTLAPVYTGTADLAFMAREIREPLERMAFEWVKLAKPYAIQYANAGFDPVRPSTQLAVFVHTDNPVDSLSMAQLDAIFGAEHRRGRSNIRAWGDVDAGGVWQTGAIRVYGPELESIAALFFRRTVMHDSRKWNPEYRESGDMRVALRALSEDAFGIAFAPIALAPPGLKALAIAPDNSKPAIALKRETAISRTYPLYRSVSVILHRRNDEPLTPGVREFLRFVLSAQGQEIVGQDGSYLPLSAVTVLRERKKLD